MNYKQQTIIGLTFIAGTVFGGLCNEYTHRETWESKQLKLNPTILTDLQAKRSPKTLAKVEMAVDVPKTIQHSTQVMEILRIIRIKESSNGTKGLAITCKKLGKSNEYGYNPPFCFESETEASNKVADWFVRKLTKYSLSQALCLYNTGTASNDCPYWRDYQTYL